MQCPLVTAPSATVSPLPMSARSLFAAFASVPDPRRQASITYPLPAILALAVTAILANQHAPLAIAAWAARQGVALLVPLGSAVGRTPCQLTLHRLFAKRHGDGLSAALSASFAPAVLSDPAARGGQGVAIDGKAQRGRLQDQAGGSLVHALAACCHEHGVVLAQEPIDHGADKREAALTVPPTLIARLDWPGRVRTGDALCCQRQRCEQVLAAGGDYLLLVKRYGSASRGGGPTVVAGEGAVSLCPLMGQPHPSGECSERTADERGSVVASHMQWTFPPGCAILISSRTGLALPPAPMGRSPRHTTRSQPQSNSRERRRDTWSRRLSSVR